MELINGQNILTSGDSLSPIALRHGIEKFIFDYSKYPLWTPWIFSGMPTVHSLINVSNHYFPHNIFILLHYTVIVYTINVINKTLMLIGLTVKNYSKTMSKTNFLRNPPP